MIRFNAPWDVAWEHHALDLVFLAATVVAIWWSVREHRRGNSADLVLYTSALAYGLLLEFTTGMMISRSYLQGEFTIMLNTTAIPGFTTDMPSYILLLYPTFIFMGAKFISAFGIESILTRAVAVGAIMVLIDAAYVVNGPLPHVGWWEWLDWEVGGIAIFEYWYGWPMADAFWEMTWPGLLMYCVWRWQRGEQERVAGGSAPATAVRKFVVVPLVVAVIVNVGGFVFTTPLSVAMAFGWPHFTVIVPILVSQACVLLFARKRPLGPDRATWLLLAVWVGGNLPVTLSSARFGSAYQGEMVIVLVTMAALVALLAWTRVAAMRRDEELAPPASPATAVPAEPNPVAAATL